MLISIWNWNYLNRFSDDFPSMHWPSYRLHFTAPHTVTTCYKILSPETLFELCKFLLQFAWGPTLKLLYHVTEIGFRGLPTCICMWSKPTLLISLLMGIFISAMSRKREEEIYEPSIKRIEQLSLRFFSNHIKNIDMP